TITETTPGVKGATASARTKPARLSSGIEVQVPEYIENGQAIKINTVNGKFIGRA
ncbi:MAG: elongation factor P-like protein YeiP, partial [Gammaproteobacteria bacterium]|nr:elongation factor P-like protein YeiP [Gammaproteobacteria bacterium]